MTGLFPYGTFSTSNQEVVALLETSTSQESDDTSAVVASACDGNCFAIATCVNKILQLIDEKKIREAREMLHSFLRHASSDEQILFFGHFDAIECEGCEIVLNAPFAGVKTLAFATPYPVEDNIESADEVFGVQPHQTAWLDFYCSLISACPDLETLTIATQCRIAFPDRLRTAILSCKNIMRLKIPNWYLRNPVETLSFLATCSHLKTLEVGLNYKPNLLELHKDVFPLFKKLLLDTRKNRDGVRDFLAKCGNLRALHVSDDSMVPIVPRGVKTLYVDLPSASMIKSVGSKIAEFQSLSRLTFTRTCSESLHLCELKEIVKAVKDLHVLKALNLSPGVRSSEKSLLHTLVKKAALHTLAIQIRYQQRELQKLAEFKKLKNLHLVLSLRKDDDRSRIEMPVNSKSHLHHLVIEAGVANKSHPCDRIAPVLRVTNPKILTFRSFRGEDNKRILPIKVTVDQGRLALVYDKKRFYLNELTRLEQVFFCDEEMWEFAKELKPLLCTAFQTHDSGEQFRVRGLDIKKVPSLLTSEEQTSGGIFSGLFGTLFGDKK